MVSANDLPETQAPLFLVSPGQINFQMPKNAPTNGAVDFTLMRQSTGEILATGSAAVRSASPALFANSTFPLPSNAPRNAVQAVAQNNGDSPVSCNGMDGTSADPIYCPGGVRPARRGEIVTLYANGQGFVTGMPDDGTGGNGQATSDPTLEIVLSNGARITPDFSGLAPTLVGVWQINFRVPDNAPPGAVGIAIRFKDLASSVSGNPTTVIMVQ